MKNRTLLRHKLFVKRAAFLFGIIMLAGVYKTDVFSQSSPWTAPTVANSYSNPLSGNDKSTIAGKMLYTNYCAICHGVKGKGDGLAGMALKPRPADFTKNIVQQQTDGAIYWKMTEGRSPMAAYKETLTEEQRWQLVNYIRSLRK